MADWGRKLGPRTRFTAVPMLSRNQVVVAVIGAVATLTVLSKLSPSPLALPAALVLAGAFTMIVLRSYKGMPLADWALKAAAHGTGRKRWQARPVGRTAEQLPRELGDVKIVAVRDRTGLVGMVREGKTLAAAARIDLRSLGLLDVGEQGRLLESVKRILDELAREQDDRYRFAMLMRHVPRRPNAELAYLRENVRDLESPQARQMVAMIKETAGASHDYEFLICVRQTARSDDRSAAVILDRLRGLIARMERAQLAVKASSSLLGPRELARVIKDTFDPFGKQVRDDLEEVRGLPGTDPAAVGPDATLRDVECYESDSAVHATLWMRGWPATDVTAGWMRPLTLHCDVPAMTVATVMKPEDRAKAIKRLGTKRTRADAARMLREEHGQEETPEQAKPASFVARQLSELADEDASAWWWETYVTVSARNRSELREAVGKVESACVECGLTPVLLRWAQADAFTFSLPLGRGLEPERGRV